MLAIGAFIMQVSVQGAWGVIPAHLNELSPGPVRATLPGFVYQAGNFLASYNGPFQARIAESQAAITPSLSRWWRGSSRLRSSSSSASARSGAAR